VVVLSQQEASVVVVLSQREAVVVVLSQQEASVVVVLSQQEAVVVVLSQQEAPVVVVLSHEEAPVVVVLSCMPSFAPRKRDLQCSDRTNIGCNFRLGHMRPSRFLLTERSQRPLLAMREARAA
jgi:hypothetical protein